LSQLAMLELFDSTPAGDALTAEALGLGQALDVGDTRLSDLLIGRGLAHSIAGRTIEAAAALDYAARLAARGGDNFSHGRALLNLADVLAGFDPETAADAARAGTELLRRVGARNYLGVAASNLVEVYLCTGRWDTAADVLAAALGPDGLDDVRYIRIQQGRLAALRGDRTTARQAIEFLAGQSSSEDPQDIAALLLLEADAAFAAGDVRTALERGRRVVELRHALGIHHETARWAWPVAARSAHDLGDHEAERALLQVLDGYAVGRLPLVLRAQRDLVTARLAAVSNGGANTAELYERAVAALRRIPDPYHLAYALLDHADYLGRSGDVAAADDAIREATKIAESLGAEPLARRAAQAQLQHS
jgi:tetratricopeptide (TPR) repeat protein